MHSLNSHPLIYKSPPYSFSSQYIHRLYHQFTTTTTTTMANSPKMLLVIVALTMTTRVVWSLEQEERISFMVSDPKFKDCSKPIIAIKGCTLSISSSLLTWRFQLTPECCKAINSLNQNCFDDLFSSNPLYGSLFPPLLETYCAA